MAGTILQQSFVVEYIVNHQMCDDCRRVEAKYTNAAWQGLRRSPSKTIRNNVFRDVVLDQNWGRDRDSGLVLGLQGPSFGSFIYPGVCNRNCVVLRVLCVVGGIFIRIFASP